MNDFFQPKKIPYAKYERKLEREYERGLPIMWGLFAFFLVIAYLKV